MPDDDNVAPALMTIACKDNHAIADAVDRIPQIRVAPANSVPVFAHVAMGSKSASFIVTARLRPPDWVIETVGQFRECRLRGKANRLRRRFDIARRSIYGTDCIGTDLLFHRRGGGSRFGRVHFDVVIFVLYLLRGDRSCLPHLLDRDLWCMRARRGKPILWIDFNYALDGGVFYLLHSAAL